MVNVYQNGEVIAVVEYTQNLDIWNGSNFQSGGIGQHEGLAQLENGQFVLIHGSDWEGVRDWAELISAETAFQKILKSGNIELLTTFPELKAVQDLLEKEK